VSVVDEIKQRLDIVELISQYVALKKAGRSYKGLCPFHTEKTPSFVVTPDRQSWYCFGACATGGDLFTFVMKKENLDFRDALELLAERAGVSLSTAPSPEEDARRARLRQANEAATLFFHHALLNSEAGRPALGYLEGRGLDRQTIEAFQLGYSPDSWDALKEHLKGRGFSEEELLAAGLLVESDRGGYDRFRHRLTFPIRDERGRAIGFGARAMDDSLPKYLNTPQSPIFDKGANLYALDRAREPIRRSGSAVIVEGYMDVIAAHQHGIDNVVASMGTALTERQMGVLKRYTKNLILALDADPAGSEATLRGVQVAADASDRSKVPVPTWRGIIRQQDVLAADIRVLSLPAGTDPDEVIRQDREAWERLVQDAKPVVDHLFQAVASRMDLSQPRERSRAARELLPLVGAIADQVVQAHYVQRLARLVQVDEDTLRRQLRRRTYDRPPTSMSPAGTPGEEPSESGGPAPTTAGAVEPQPVLREPREEYCLALLLRYPDLREEGLAADDDLFSLTENRQVLQAWRRTPDPAGLRATLPEELHEQLDRIREKTIPSFDRNEAERALANCLWGIEQRRLETEKQASTFALADSQDKIGPTRLIELATTTSADREEQPPALTPEIEEEVAREAADLLTEDTEAGQRVHRRILERNQTKVADGGPGPSGPN
jgi:DNA primase